MVKNLSAMQETHVRSLGQEDVLEKGMATHSSILTWRIPWTEEAGGATVHWVAKESDTTTAASESAAQPLGSLKFIISHLEQIRVNMLGKV